MTLAEIRKAISRRSSHKAPGSDNFPGVVYKRLPALQGELVRVLNPMLSTRKFPEVLCRIRLVPIFKPGKDPKLAASRRPITLLPTMVKISETALYHRLLPMIEPQLHGGQYAYRRERGTSHHLTELGDFAQRALISQHYCYMVSLDAEGAFDNVPRVRLLKAREEMGVGGRERRAAHNWLRGRMFQVEMRTPAGDFYSNVYEISKGLPQGGVLSPLLWIIFFDDVMGGLDHGRPEPRGTLTRRQNLVYADDVAALIS